MSFKLPTIYLAGAIRDNRLDDIQWREDIIRELAGFAVFLNPLAGKIFDQITGKWTVYNESTSQSRYIVKKDFWCVDHADILIINLNCLVEGYPTIGSLIEFGRTTRSSTLIYSIIDPNYKGHGHKGMYGLHPFILENSAMVFQDVASCVSFMRGELKATSGLDPHYAGAMIPKGGFAKV